MWRVVVAMEQGGARDVPRSNSGIPREQTTGVNGREGRATSNSGREGVRRNGPRYRASRISPQRALREAKRLSDRPAPSRDLGWPAAPSTTSLPPFFLFFFKKCLLEQSRVAHSSQSETW